jgi:hypothetical protein
MAMNKPLREGINEFLTDYVQGKVAVGEAIDSAELVYEMAQSLVDLIMKEELERQALLFALVLAGLGEDTFCAAMHWILSERLRIE